MLLDLTPVGRAEAGFTDSTLLVSESRRAGAVVPATGAGDPGKGRLFGALDDSVVAEPRCPVYGVKRARALSPAGRG